MEKIINMHLDIIGQNPAGITSLNACRKVKLSDIFTTPNQKENALVAFDEFIKVVEKNNLQNRHSEIFFVSGYINDETPLFLRQLTVQKAPKGDDCELRLNNVIILNPQINKFFKKNPLNTPTRIVLDKGMSFDTKKAISDIEMKIDSGNTVSQAVRIRPYITEEIFSENNIEEDDLPSNTANFSLLKNQFSLPATTDLLKKIDDPKTLKAFPDTPPRNEVGVGSLSKKERILINSYDKIGSFFIDTPLSQNKYQFITALLVQSFLNNEKTCFISNTKASADIIKQNLKKYQLDQILINSHAQTAYETTLNKQIKNLFLVPKISNIDISYIDQLESVSRDLKNAFDEVHKPKDPWNISYFSILEEQLETQNSHYNFDIKFSRDTTVNISENFEKYLELIKTYLKNNDEDANPGIWTNAKIKDEQDVQKVFVSLSRLVDVSFAGLLADIEDMCQQIGIANVRTFNEWNEVGNLLSDVRRTFDIFLPEVFERDIEVLLHAFDTDTSNVSFFERRRLLKEVKSLLRPGLKVDNLQEILLKAKDEQLRWFKMMGVEDLHDNVIGEHIIVKIPSSTLQVLSLSNAVEIDLETIETIFNSPLKSLGFGELKTLLKQLLNEFEKLERLPSYQQTNSELAFAGLSEFANLLLEKNVDKRHIPNIFKNLWLTSIREQMEECYPLLTELNSNYFDLLIRKFIEYDKTQVNNLSFPAKLTLYKKVTYLNKTFPGVKQIETYAEKNQYQSFSSFVKMNAKFYDMLAPILACSPEMFNQNELDSEMFDTIIIDINAQSDFNDYLNIITKTKRVIVLSDFASEYTAAQSFAKFLPTTSFEVIWTGNLEIGKHLKRNKYPFLVQNCSLPENESQNISFIKTDNLVKETIELVSKTVQSITDEINDKTEKHHHLYIFESLDILNKVKGELKTMLLNSPELMRKFCEVENFINMEYIDNNAFCESDEIYYIFDNNSSQTDESNETSLVEIFNKLAKHSLFDSFKKNLTLIASGQNAVDFTRELNKFTSSQADLIKNANINSSHNKAKTSKILKHITDRVIGQYNGELTVIHNYNLSTNDNYTIPLVLIDNSTKKFVAVLFDDVLFGAEKSLRTKLIHKVENLERLGWKVVRLYSCGYITNENLEVAKILVALKGEEKTISQINNDQTKPPSHEDKIREQEILREVPPHNISK